MSYSQSAPKPPQRPDAIGLQLIPYKALCALLEAARRRRDASASPAVAERRLIRARRETLARYADVSFFEPPPR